MSAESVTPRDPQIQALTAALSRVVAAARASAGEASGDLLGGGVGHDEVQEVLVGNREGVETAPYVIEMLANLVNVGLDLLWW